MGDQELQDPEEVSKIWFKTLNNIVNEMNNTKSLLIGMKSKDTIELDSVEANKSETYPEENFYPHALPEDDFYRYLHQPGKQHGHEKRRWL